MGSRTTYRIQPGSSAPPWPSGRRFRLAVARLDWLPRVRESSRPLGEDLGVGPAKVVGVEGFDGNRYAGQELSEADPRYPIAARTLDSCDGRVWPRAVNDSGDRFVAGYEQFDSLVADSFQELVWGQKALDRGDRFLPGNLAKAEKDFPSACVERRSYRAPPARRDRQGFEQRNCRDRCSQNFSQSLHRAQTNSKAGERSRP